MKTKVPVNIIYLQWEIIAIQPNVISLAMTQMEQFILKLKDENKGCCCFLKYNVIKSCNIAKGMMEIFYLSKSSFWYWLSGDKEEIQSLYWNACSGDLEAHHGLLLLSAIILINENTVWFQEPKVDLSLFTPPQHLLCSIATSLQS